MTGGASKFLFIVNPAAGHGRAGSRWRNCAEWFLHRYGGCVWLTSRPGHAAELAAQGLREGFRTIIAVGGDGTLGEVVHGYLSAAPDLRAGAVLGTWPAGSGCDLAGALGISREPVGWERTVSNPALRRLDAGRAVYRDYQGRTVERFFLNMAALGLAGEVAWRVQRQGKRWGGTLTYLKESVGAILAARPRPIEWRVDGAEVSHSRCHLVVLANTPRIGGGMRIAPGADPEDGRMDLVVVGDVSRWELLRRFPRIYTGGHIHFPGVIHRRVVRLEVRSSENVHLNIDGEVAGILPATFEVLPGAIPFLCPSQS